MESKTQDILHTRIQAISPKPNLSRNASPHPTYPYLLSGVEVVYPNQVWGVDITYIRLHKDWLYLVAIMDWYSRYVLSWDLSDSLESDFCVLALGKALDRAIPAIHNSDQGVQFTSQEYLAVLLAKPKIQISMDHRGRCFDNIFTERLWRSLKYEEVYLKDYGGYKEARCSIGNYFDFYNTKRKHQSLGNKTPEQVYLS